MQDFDTHLCHVWLLHRGSSVLFLVMNMYKGTLLMAADQMLLMLSTIC